MGSLEGRGKPDGLGRLDLFDDGFILDPIQRNSKEASARSGTDTTNLLIPHQENARRFIAHLAKEEMVVSHASLPLWILMLGRDVAPKQPAERAAALARVIRNHVRPVPPSPLIPAFSPSDESETPPTPAA